MRPRGASGRGDGRPEHRRLGGRFRPAAPVKRVRSYQGPEHCSWTDITFLLIGPDWYVRDPAGEFPELLRGTFDGDATLPEEATSTGWRRDGRELWLADNAAYLVAVDDRRDVERWPAAREPILCA